MFGEDVEAMRRAACQSGYGHGSRPQLSEDRGGPQNDIITRIEAKPVARPTSRSRSH